MSRVDSSAGTTGSDVGYENTADETWAQHAIDLYRRLLRARRPLSSPGSAEVYPSPCHCGSRRILHARMSAMRLLRDEFVTIIANTRAAQRAFFAGSSAVLLQGCLVSGMTAPWTVQGCGAVVCRSGLWHRSDLLR